MDGISELIFGVLAILFYKGYRARHPELLGKPAKDLALTYVKLQLIHHPKAIRFLFLSPILPALIVALGLLIKADLLTVILIALLTLLFEYLGSVAFLIPVLKFHATVDPSEVAVEKYLTENKAALVELALKDPQVVKAHKQLGKYLSNRAIRKVRTKLYNLN